ncbi:hypothetical protein BDZ91DRAFT_486988 [Kalaharituber pfeilii]|nr:hypothetical protein BDZ91DRAFT_486988 [Kalaharituber pfeilii]
MNVYSSTIYPPHITSKPLALYFTFFLVSVSSAPGVERNKCCISITLKAFWDRRRYDLNLNYISSLLPKPQFSLTIEASSTLLMQAMGFFFFIIIIVFLSLVLDSIRAIP